MPDERCSADLTAPHPSCPTVAAVTLPIQFQDALAARERIRPYLQPTTLRSYEALDEEIGSGIRVLVKHENHQPTNAFKIRNALSVLTLLSEEQRVVTATQGNHG